MGNSFKNRRIMIFLEILCTFCLLAFLSAERSLAETSRGIKVSVKDVSGKEIPLYAGSYALLIGVSDYTAGWPDLNNIPSELDRVEKALQKQGFRVTRITDPDSKALTNSFEEFIDKYGFDTNNRLLFFFSGHGHTRKGGEKGYLVPTDAPHPLKDERGFLRKALPMDQIIAWSRQMEAKHALFLFDSCFSGTVFKMKSLPTRPPHITHATSLPVRQYITAGDAGDAVPAASVFTPVFIDALEYGWADLNGDGYISGTELGIYLQEKVPQHTSQTPQYGKIKDYKLSRGDYIFLIKQESESGTLRVETTPPGAKILIDGRLKGTSPLELTGLKPGRLTVEAKKDGYVLWKEQVLLRKDRALEVSPVLKEIIENGILEIKCDINQARWYLDEGYAGRTPDEMKDVSPGTHRITIKTKGYPDWSELVNVEPGKRVTVNAQFRSEAKNAVSQESRLYVDTDPENATVKIMNIGPKYHRGMLLSPGSYHVKVSATGFDSKDQWIQLSKGEERHIDIHLAMAQPALTQKRVTHSTRVTQPSLRKVSGRDGIYVLFSNGIILDTKTGLEWKAGPEKNTNWGEARAWVENLNLEGGGWRMPTKEEIKSLYKPGTGSCNMTPLFKINAWWVWTGETKSPRDAWIFYFSGGYGYWLKRSTSDNLRAFAVRSGKIGDSPEQRYVNIHKKAAEKPPTDKPSVQASPQKSESESGGLFKDVKGAFQSFKENIFSDPPDSSGSSEENQNKDDNFNAPEDGVSDPYSDFGA